MSATVRPPRPDRSSSFRLELGTKICLLLALMFLIASAFMFFTPLSAPTSNGSLFDCKSAFQPPKDDFSKAACGNVNDIYQFRALMMLIGAVLVATTGAALFGFSRKASTDHDLGSAPVHEDTGDRPA